MDKKTIIAKSKERFFDKMQERSKQREIKIKKMEDTVSEHKRVLDSISNLINQMNKTDSNKTGPLQVLQKKLEKLENESDNLSNKFKMLSK